MFSKVSFDIWLERDGRWVMETGGLEEEPQAMETAHRLLRQNANCTAVKVMKSTVSIAGNKRESEIFKKVKDPNEEAPLVLTGSTENAPLCKDAAECYQLPSRMVLNRLLRMFLDKYQITAIEALHNYTYLKKFDDAGSLVGALFHQLGGAQSKKLNVPHAERLKQLMDYYKAIHNAARDFNITRKELPKFDFTAPDASYTKLKQADGKNTRYNFYGLLSAEFLSGTYGAREPKLELASSMLEKTTHTELKSWLDEFIADCLCFPETVDGLLGKQYNFNELLLRLIEIIRGGLPLTKAKDTPVLARLRVYLDNKTLESTRAVFMDILMRDMRSENPLDKRDPDQEEVLLKKLEVQLKFPDGSFLGGREMENALSTRKLRERKRKLRAMGLDDVADSLK